MISLRRIRVSFAYEVFLDFLFEGLFEKVGYVNGDDKNDEDNDTEGILWPCSHLSI